MQTHHLDLPVFWHGDKAGQLGCDGPAWSLEADLPIALGSAVAGRLDTQLESLMPEGWLASVTSGDDRVLLATPRRLLSNLETGEASGVDERIVEDGDLARWGRDGVFAGRLEGLPDAGVEALHPALAGLYERDAGLPLMSGAQVKIPFSLDAAGLCLPAAGRAFTHLWKAPGTGASGWTALGSVEWFCMRLTAAAGVEVAPTALARHQAGAPPGLLVERFDLRRGDEKQLLLAADALALMGLQSGDKYTPSMERVAKAIMQASSAPDADGERLYRQVVAAWVMGNGDLHAKNLSMLRAAAGPGQTAWSSIRLSPAYDMLCTRVFSGLENDQMALTLGGKRGNFKPAQWRALGKLCRLTPDAAQAIFDEVVVSVSGQALALVERLPEAMLDHEESVRAIEGTAEIVLAQAHSVGLAPERAEAQAGPAPG